jgi:serine/threonine protein kinase/Tfp pilus assembly protein PilF
MIGQTLSHYRILEKIGQGGMGVVYKALDLHLDRYVAVKMLPKERVADPERRRRFIQEAKSASALNHPNIITIHDIDEADGICFIAMEYIPGKTLQEMIAESRLELNQSLDYAVQIADALSKAHAAGIVHRDIKPSNVMVTDENLAKVLDFGLAKLAGWPAGLPDVQENARTPSLSGATREGVILGTLSYMSPEQARGREVDRRTDIFSLGVVLFQMIAGELPFRGPHAAAVLDKLLYTPTPSLKGVRSDLPEALERTIERATAKEPANRYQNMQEMASDLRSIRSTGELALPVPKKKRWRLAVMFVAAMMLLLLITLPFRDRLPRWLGGRALPQQIRMAVLQFNNVGSDAENQKICDGLMERLATKLNQTEKFRNSLSIVPPSEIRTEKVTSASGAHRIFGANLVLTGSVQKLRDQIILTINLVDSVKLKTIDGQVFKASMTDLLALEDDAFEKAAAMLALNLNPHERQALRAGETNNADAYNSYVQGIGCLVRFDMAENVDKAIQFFQNAVEEDPRFALAHAGLGEAYWRKFQQSKETKWIDAALSSCRRAAEIDSRVSQVHITQGILYLGMGQPEKAVGELKKAIEMEPRSSEAYRELARAYEDMHKTAEAEATYKKAIELKPDSWSCYSNLGVFYYYRARYKEAAEQFKKVIELTPDNFLAFSGLGGIYLYEGDFGKAGDMFARSLAIRPSANAYSNLAASYLLQGRSSEAVPLLEKATAMDTANYMIWGNLGDAYYQTPGLSQKAPAAYALAVEIVTKDLAVNPNDNGARARLAFYLLRLGDTNQALDEIARAEKSAPKDSDVMYWAAVIYESAGDREKALNALAKAAAEDYSLAIIRATSEFSQLRKDPRFGDLIVRQRSH